MKVVINFKDGSKFVNDLGDDFVISGTGNLLELLTKGKQLNSNITLFDEKTGELIQRTYSDVYSFEIILE